MALPASAARSLLRRAASTFHDSQSGLVLTTPGSAGVRLHALLSAQPPPRWPTQPPGLPPYSLELPLAALTASAPLPAGHRLFAPVATPADVAALASLSSSSNHPRGRHAAESIGAALHFPPADVAKWLPLLAAAVAASLPTRVCLSHAWARPPGAHRDTNAALRAVEDAVGRVADAGAGAVVLCDDGGVGTEESVREALEACFNLDVAGDALLERLGVRMADAVGAGYALEHGVTRLDCAVGAWAGGSGVGVVGFDEAVGAVRDR